MPDLPTNKGGLWARLFAMAPEDDKPAEVTADTPVAAPPNDFGVGFLADGQAEDLAPLAPTALPLDSEPSREPIPEGAAEPAMALEEGVSTSVSETIKEPVEPVVLQPCAACGAERKQGQAFCGDCGYFFPEPGSAVVASGNQGTSQVKSGMPAMTKMRVKDRYEIGELLSESGGVTRYRAFDHAGGTPVPVVVLCAARRGSGDAVFEGIPVVEDEEYLPSFDVVTPVAEPAAEAAWPSIAWERNVLEKAKRPSLPAVVDFFEEDNFEFLVKELPQGRSLWDAWDDADADASVRYGWLVQVAQALSALHQAGAMIEGIRPDFITVTPAGQAVIHDLSELLPLPLPPDAPVKASLYTAPELILAPDTADARAALYSFGAMLYSLEYLHHPLEEGDFEHPFTPKQITDRFPDVHPLFFRLVNKTFVRDVETRFPTDEASKTDPTGFEELIKTLEVCRRALDRVRLDIAAWSTTGMVRTGNEDAFAVLHGCEWRQDDLWEYAMVLLCDGMGGYEAGEVAAALAISEMRKFLLAQPMFAALAGKWPPEEPVDGKAYQESLLAALRHANKEVYAAARTPGGRGRRGMGCTAECVYVDNKHVFVGHVGDSRAYHLRQGRLVQLTRDQTFVQRMVELGQLTEEEAEQHPRKNELQQAIGGQPDVVPGAYSAKLKRGDWILVCSDGLSNHIPAADLENMLTREAAYSAEEAARRLLNLVNLRGATDNATIVVVRAS